MNLIFVDNLICVQRIVDAVGSTAFGPSLYSFTFFKPINLWKMRSNIFLSNKNKQSRYRNCFVHPSIQLSTDIYGSSFALFWFCKQRIKICYVLLAGHCNTMVVYQKWFLGSIVVCNIYVMLLIIDQFMFPNTLN